MDVNTLVALFDPGHQHHESASEWFDLYFEEGWLTCPLTQNGCVRVLSQPHYPGTLPVVEALARLRTAVSTPYHQFISDDISILDETLVEVRHLTGHRQLTDAYLLALAVAHEARLVTLDTGIPLDAVHGATSEHLVVL